LNKAPAWAHVSLFDKENAAATAEVVAWILYSIANGWYVLAFSFVIAMIVKPLPAFVTSVLSCVPTPITRSPAAVGVMFPLEGAELEPVAPAAASSGAVVLAPENSAAIIDNSLPAEAVRKVTVVAPLLTFLA
jgi:hypothetical protein